MYESFYQFQEKPFSLLPDPRFLFHSVKHDMALAKLEYGLLNKAGFTVISGGIGTGKTTLIRHMLHHLDRDLTVGLINNTHGAFGSLMDWISMAFSLPRKGKDDFALFYQFMDFIIEEYGAGRRTVLIMDEAQNMPVEMLEELRVLSNINADKDQLLQIILVGQTELEDSLSRPELVQFAQRIAVHFALTPLREDETAGYIRHRLEVAGGPDNLFEPEALAAIHHYSGGVPRLINVLSDAALVCGFAVDSPVITAALVHQAARDQQISGLLPLAATVADDVGERVAPENNRLPERASKAPPTEAGAAPVINSVPETDGFEKVSADHETAAKRDARPPSDVPWMPRPETGLSSSNAVQSASQEERERSNGARPKEITNKALAAVLLTIVLTAGALWLVASSSQTPESASPAIVAPLPAGHAPSPKMMASKDHKVSMDQEPRVYAAPAVLAAASGTEDSTQSLSRGEDPSAASAVLPDGRITELLGLAKEALREYRLMIPAERNAYNYYQEVLSLDSHNPDALDGLGQIVERYVWLAGRSLQRQNNERARLYITRGLRVRPGDKRLLTLKDRMNRPAGNERPEHRAAEVRVESTPHEEKQPRNLFRKLQDFVF
ncbi:MAG: AAA family ATPase [bacterium]|nr:AAA family ATPase [bacterium]